jgi:hypothetical protein
MVGIASDADGKPCAALPPIPLSSAPGAVFLD